MQLSALQLSFHRSHPLLTPLGQTRKENMRSSPSREVFTILTLLTLLLLTSFPGDSDLLTVYNAYCAWKRIRNTPGANEYSFCRKNFLSPQTLINIEDIKMQLLVSIADAGLLKLDATEQASLNRYVSSEMI